MHKLTITFSAVNVAYSGQCKCGWHTTKLFGAKSAVHAAYAKHTHA